MQMEWSKVMSLRLIEEYKKHECLWDPLSSNYKLKIPRVDAWAQISRALECDEDEVEKKMASLQASFRRERKKMLKLAAKGQNTETLWFAYKSLLFLNDRYRPRPTSIAEPKEPKKLPAVEEASETSQNTSKATFNKRKIMYHLAGVEDAYRMHQEAVTQMNNRDESTVFGEHVALKHRKYTPYTRNIVEHLIGNIMFEADMGKYQEPPSSLSASLPSPSVAPSLFLSPYQHSAHPSSPTSSSSVPLPPSTLIKTSNSPAPSSESPECVQHLTESDDGDSN